MVTWLTYTAEHSGNSLNYISARETLLIQLDPCQYKDAILVV